MTLALILTEYAEVIGDSLVNDAGLTVERVLRYHGHAPPEDMECGRVLSVWWEGPALTNAGGKCGGPLTVQLAAKYVMCWKPAKAKANSTILLYDDQWDADAATLADAAELVSRRLQAFACATRGDPMPDLDAALMQHLREPRFVGATPTGAAGTAAGIVWRLSGGIIPAAPVSS